MSNIINHFFQFYGSRGYTIYPSLPLIHKSFPTTYVPSAGEPHIFEMLERGETLEPTNFMVKQPCFRSVDIGKTGKTISHLSLFEMLGAFSVIPVDFSESLENIKINFTQEKLRYLKSSFSFMIDHLKLPKERVWVTVFGGDMLPITRDVLPEDRVTLDFFKKIGIPDQNIILKGIPDNYLLRLQKNGDSVTISGDTSHEPPLSPTLNAFCGVRIEVFYERENVRPCHHNNCGPSFCDCQRFIEISTSAFTDKFILQQDNDIQIVDPPYFILYNAYGYERLKMILRGTNTIFQIDELKTLTETIEGFLSDLPDENQMNYICCMSDFIRGIAFIVAAGGKTGRKKRNHLLKRVLRKLLLYARLLKIDPSILLEKLLDEVISIYSGRYPEIAQKRHHIMNLIMGECHIYEKLLDHNLKKLNRILDNSKKQDLRKEEVEKFSSTYGLPRELLIDTVIKRGFSIK